jgi:hypothetical protein
MSSTKRISGNYNIVSIDPSAGDNVNVTTHTVNITGNLAVMGNITYIETTELKVDDPFITVAANNNGTIGTATYQQQGLVAQTSGNTFAGLRFNNSTLDWEISPSVDGNGAPITAYSTISTSTAGGPGGSNTSVQFNNGSGGFGGDLNLTYDTTIGRLTLVGYEVFENIPVAPTILSANVTALYRNPVGAGGTGLWFKNIATTDELVSKSTAIVFALIF